MQAPHPQAMRSSKEYCPGQEIFSYKAFIMPRGPQHAAPSYSAPSMRSVTRPLIPRLPSRVATRTSQPRAANSSVRKESFPEENPHRTVGLLPRARSARLSPSRGGSPTPPPTSRGRRPRAAASNPFPRGSRMSTPVPGTSPLRTRVPIPTSLMTRVKECSSQSHRLMGRLRYRPGTLTWAKVPGRGSPGEPPNTRRKTPGERGAFSRSV